MMHGTAALIVLVKGLIWSRVASRCDTAAWAARYDLSVVVRRGCVLQREPGADHLRSHRSSGCPICQARYIGEALER